MFGGCYEESARHLRFSGDSGEFFAIINKIDVIYLRKKKYSPRPRKYSPRKKNILFYVPPRLPYISLVKWL